MFMVDDEMMKSAPPGYNWVPREGGEASGDKFDGNFLENADSVHAEKNALI